MIKIAIDSNVPQIKSLLLESFMEFKKSYTADAFKATVISETEITKRMHEGPVWICTDENQIVGTVSAIIQDKSLYIRGMAVHPASRGMKTGEKLLNQTENFAISNNINRLYLGTTSYLKSAIRLYERCGFVRYDVTDFYGMELIMMEKYIKTAI